MSSENELSPKGRRPLTWSIKKVEPLFLHIKRSHQASNKDALDASWARCPTTCPTGRGPLGRARARWKEYIFKLKEVEHGAVGFSV